MHDMLVGPRFFFCCIFNPHMAREDMYVRSREWSTAIGKEADDRSASDLFQMLQCLYGTEG